MDRSLVEIYERKTFQIPWKTGGYLYNTILGQDIPSKRFHIATKTNHSQSVNNFFNF